MRKLFFIAPLAIALILSGCSSNSNANSLEKVTTNINNVSGNLELEFPAPLEIKERTFRVMSEGEGDPVKHNSDVTVSVSAYNADTGELASEPTENDTIPVGDSLENSDPELHAALMSVRVGGSFILAMPNSDTQSASVIYLVNIISVEDPVSRATGTLMPPVEGMPTVTLSDNGEPTITVPDSPAPETLQSIVLIEGDGPVVESGEKITVHYKGEVWGSGVTFDSSWDRGQPYPFAIGTGSVIKGWDEGLVGKKVGSQILLVIPSELGYGSTGSGEKIAPNSTLVFVVDILKAV